MFISIISTHKKRMQEKLSIGKFLEDGKVSKVEKVEVYAEGIFQLEVVETNKDKNNIILLYILVHIRHYSKHFSYINSFNLRNILQSRYY